MKTFVSRPSAPLLPLALVKDHLRVDQDDSEFDRVIATYMLSAEMHAENFLGCPISRQTFSETFSGPNHVGQFLIEGGPACAVTKLEILIGGDYVEQDPSLYAVRPANRVTTLVRAAAGRAWPAHDCDEAAFRFTYQLGFEVVEAPLEAAMLMLIGDLFTNRDAKIPVTLGDNPTVGRLLGSYRAPSL